MDQKKEYDVFKKNAKRITVGEYKRNDFGLCSRCRNFCYRETELRTIGYCDYDSHIKLSMVDPVRECSDFYPIGRMGLADMWAIATLVDLEHSNKIGFGLDEKVVFTKTNVVEERF